MKTIKKISSLCLVSLLLSLISFGQTKSDYYRVMSLNNGNYYNIEGLNDPEENEGPEENELSDFTHWNDFWKYRVNQIRY